MRAVRRAAGVAAALACLAVVPIGATAAHAECTTPELPVVGCPLPSASASPSPSATPSATSDPTPSALPTSPTPSRSPVVAVPARQGPQLAPAPGGSVAVAPAFGAPAAPLVPAAEPVPQVAPAAPVARSVALARPATLPIAAVSVSALSGTVAASFALVVFGLLALPLLLGFLAGLRSRSSGGTVNSSRPRLWVGLAVWGLAAVIGGIGWYRVSGEPLLNRQIPFLASAGIVVVLLSVLAGSLIVAEQLRGDQTRIRDLEDAVRTLTEALAPSIELPARREVQEVGAPTAPR